MAFANVFLFVCVCSLLRAGIAAPCAQLQQDLSFDHCVDLDSKNNTYALAWKTDSNNIWIAIDVENPDPNGWAGFGLSEAGGMKAADLTVVYKSVNQPNVLNVQDLWSVDTVPPRADAHSDVVLVSPLAAGQPVDTLTPSSVPNLSSVPGRIRAVVRRPLHSCDKEDISFTPGLPQHFIWAYGGNWPRYHGAGRRGETVITFHPGKNEPVQATVSATLEEGAEQLDVVMPAIKIPAAPTSYLCTHVHLPDDNKYHMVARQALIRSPLVHHMILFGCTPSSSPRTYTAGDVFDCTSMEAECSQFVVGWAPGQEYQSYGHEAGFPFGSSPNDPSLSNWFVLQTHYNNPTGVESSTPDSSGLRITYTPRLRPNDFGVLTLTQLNLNLPPGQDKVVTPPNLCPAECTSRLDHPVTMMYTLLHMHQTGTTITTRHIRGGEELQPLGSRSVYDFNHQGSEPIPYSTRQLMPGDSLITQCTYDTRDRTNTTRFGEGTMDEMCFNFVVYYPKTRLEGCSSMGMDKPGGRDEAMCGTSADISKATDGTPGTPPVILDTSDAEALKSYVSQRRQRLLDAGLLVNATWPTRYQPWTDAECPNTSDNVGRVVLIAPHSSASGDSGAAPAVQATSSSTP